MKPCGSISPSLLKRMCYLRYRYIKRKKPLISKKGLAELNKKIKKNKLIIKQRMTQINTSSTDITIELEDARKFKTITIHEILMDANKCKKATDELETLQELKHFYLYKKVRTTKK